LALNGGEFGRHRYGRNRPTYNLQFAICNLQCILRAALLLSLALSFSTAACADEPAASYIFPAGGQRGTQVEFRVGGLCLHDGAAFELIGPGVTASPRVTPTDTIWFEGPIIPLPASQQKEDYPKDFAGAAAIAADAPPGLRYWRLATSQGATPAMKFVVGELPEVVEREVEGDALPVGVTLPVTINGRIFPREDIDEWTFEAKQGETIRAENQSARLGYPLEARLVLLDSNDRPLAEDVGSLAGDALVRATIPADGTYKLRIHDINFSGLQHFVYRLTVTSGPCVERIYPLGGRRGSTAAFELSGQGLPAAQAEIALAPNGPSFYRHRIEVSGQMSNRFAIELDNHPEFVETEPNDAPSQSSPRVVPAVFNGRIGQPGDVDCWTVEMRQGQALEIDVRASRLGSPLDSVLTVLDAGGKELARADDLPNQESDSQLTFTAPADGRYVMRVEERFASRGGPAFAYRLLVAPPPAPDFSLRLATDAVALNRGAQAKLRITAERLGGFGDAIRLELAGLPEGVTAAPVEIAANQAQAEFVLSAEKTAKILTAHLAVRGMAEIGGQSVSRAAVLPAPPGELEIGDVLLAVSVPTPFKVVGRYDITFVPRGTFHRRHYTIDRGGYEGPLMVRMADRQMRHLQGVSGPSIAVPAGATECDFSVYMPPWMELARTSRSCVMAVGEIVDPDGSRHTVSFTSQNQNEQIVALVGPGPISLRADAATLVATPDSRRDVTIHVARDAAWRVPVRLELIVPKHVAGISAECTTIAPGDDRATLSVHFAHDIGPLNMPLVVRATTLSDAPPVVAETKLELVAK
jgi:hypothetical protein